METTFNKMHPFAAYNKRELGAVLIFYLIWPFGAWLYSLFRCPKTKGAYFVFFLFSLLLCWHFSPNYSVGHYDDFLGILERFNGNNISTDKLLAIYHDYFSFSDNAEKDLYESTLNWVTRLFSDNYHLFFLIASIPVALCQLTVMKRLTGDIRFKNASVIGVVLLIMFIFPRDIITVQNPRFTTGFWLAVLGTIDFYCENMNGTRHWTSIFLVLLAPLCHSGLFLYAALFVAGVFVKPTRLLEIIAIVSIPFSLFDAGLLHGISASILPANLQIWAEHYMSDDSFSKYVLNEGRSGFWWITDCFEFMMKLVYVVMAVQLIRNRQETMKNAESSSLYAFFLFLFSIVNLIQFVPVLGERYYWFVRILCLFVWFKSFGFTKSNMLYLLLFSCSFAMFKRYGYILGGALSVTTNPDMFIMPLPYLIATGFIR